MKGGPIVPRTLKEPGKRVLNAAANNFYAAYKEYLKEKAIEAITPPPNREGFVLDFFKGRKTISGYSPQGFGDRRRGCKTATVNLHPHPDWWDRQLRESETTNLPRALVDVKRKRYFTSEEFISGHVINATFGGDFERYENQTVLTHTANGQHFFDQTVKKAVEQMSRACYQMAFVCGTDTARLAEICDAWWITINATVNDRSWYDAAGDEMKKAFAAKQGYPLNAIATTIVFSATSTGKPDHETIAGMRISENKVHDIARSIRSFDHYMEAVKSWTLTQNVPADATSKSEVSTA